MMRVRLLLAMALCWPGLAGAQTPFGFVEADTNPNAPPPADVLDDAGVSKQDTYRPTPGELAAAGKTLPEAMAGGMDLAPSLQAALARGVVRLPCGQYRLDSTVAATSSGQAIIGNGSACTIVLLNFASGTGLLFGVDAAGPGDVAASGRSQMALSGVHVFSANQRAAGYAVRAVGVHNFALRDVVVDGGQAGCVEIDGGRRGAALGNGFGTSLTDVELGTCAATGLHITGYARNVFINGKFQAGVGPQSMRVDDASGVYISLADLSPGLTRATGNGVSNVLVNPSATLGQNVNSIFATNLTSDSCDGHCWELAPAPDGTSGGISDIKLNGGWGAGSTRGAGLIVQPGTRLDGMTISGGWGAHLNWQAGIDLKAGRNIKVIGADIYNNGVAAALPNLVAQTSCGPALHPGIRIGPAVESVIVMGTQSTGGGYMYQHGKINCQSYGLDAGAGIGDGRALTVIGNQFPGNLAGGRRMPSGARVVDLGNTE